LNNLIETDHDKLKRQIKPTLSFQALKSAYATLKGFEVMRALKKQQGPGLSRSRTASGVRYACWSGCSV